MSKKINNITNIDIIVKEKDTDLVDKTWNPIWFNNRKIEIKMFYKI